MTAAALSGLPQGAASAAAPAGPQIIAGTLINARGDVLANAEVVVRVEHYDAERDADIGIPIGRGFTNAAGKFVVRGGLTAPATKTPDGSVRLEVTAGTADEHRMFVLNARPPAPGRPDWTWGSTPDMKTLPAPAAGHASARANQVLSGLALRTGGTADASNTFTAATSLVEGSGDYFDRAVDGTVDTDDVIAPDNTASADAAMTCEATMWQTLPESDTTVAKRYVTIQRMRVNNRSVSHYDWSTTRKTQMSIAYTGAGDDYEGGLAYARSQDDSAGVNSKSPETYWNGYSRVQFKFRKQALYCDNTPGNFGLPVDTGKRRWLPYNFTGFNKMVLDSATWTCNPDHAGPIYSTTWVSKEVRNR